PNLTDNNGHFATVVGGNLAAPHKNRTIYKRKIEYKTIAVYEKCPEGATGAFVYYLSCNQYLNCWKGRGEVQNCAPGTLFNPTTLECDFPAKVECVTGRQNSITLQTKRSRSVVQATCPDGFTGLIPNYTDCAKFINCNNGQQAALDCPPGTLFDTTQNICNFPHLVTCFNGEAGVGYQGQGNWQEQGRGQETQGHREYQYWQTEGQTHGCDQQAQN
ncbi:hypothetical protein NQ315_000309, partial [Exocentrus adspersus]